MVGQHPGEETLKDGEAEIDEGSLREEIPRDGEAETDEMRQRWGGDGGGK